MNKRGFTLIELLATIIVLSIVLGIAIVSVNHGFKNAKNKTEDVFVKTIEDSLVIYIDSDAKSISFSSASSVCTINKRFGSTKVYKNSGNLTFQDVINSEYVPLVEGELVNPANEGTDKHQCFKNGYGSNNLSIYRDDDYIYYYLIDKSVFGCLNNTGYITNLPCDCLNSSQKAKVDRCKTS